MEGSLLEDHPPPRSGASKRPHSSPLLTAFLGMIFDELLTWVPHLKSLRLTCQSPLDLFRHLPHTTWGADRKSLLRLYTSLVLSKLDYGSSVYSSAAASISAVLTHYKAKDSAWRRVPSARLQLLASM